MKKIFVLMIMLLALTLTGCGDKKELEELINLNGDKVVYLMYRGNDDYAFNEIRRSWIEDYSHYDYRMEIIQTGGKIKISGEEVLGYEKYKAVMQLNEVTGVWIIEETIVIIFTNGDDLYIPKSMISRITAHNKLFYDIDGQLSEDSFKKVIDIKLKLD